jgi:hypothetical protein
LVAVTLSSCGSIVNKNRIANGYCSLLSAAIRPRLLTGPVSRGFATYNEPNGMSNGGYEHQKPGKKDCRAYDSEQPIDSRYARDITEQKSAANKQIGDQVIAP